MTSTKTTCRIISRHQTRFRFFSLRISDALLFEQVAWFIFFWKKSVWMPINLETPANPSSTKAWGERTVVSLTKCIETRRITLGHKTCHENTVGHLRSYDRRRMTSFVGSWIAVSLDLVQNTIYNVIRNVLTMPRAFRGSRFSRVVILSIPWMVSQSHFFV